MIIVEDGTIVDGANSWVSLVDFLDYAESMGLLLNDEDKAEISLKKAAQFINSKEPRLRGTPVERDQPTSYPRHNLTIEGFSWSEFEIPRQVILCQLNLALDIYAGIDPYNPPTNPNRAVKREKIDVIEVEYMGADKSAELSRNSLWQALLSSLMTQNGLSIAFRRTL